jgi:hypothetical protein
MGSYPNIGALANTVALGQQARQSEFEQPARMKALNVATQGQSLENQQRQIALNDQKAMTAAMHDWDGANYETLPALVIKRGGSANAVMGLKKSILDYQTAQASKTKTDLENENAVHDEVVGALSPGLDPKQVSDQDLPNWIRSTAQDLLARKKIDPQHEQTAEQLAQLPPDQARKNLDLIRKGYMGQSAINTDLAKQAEAKMNTAKAALDAAQTEAANYKEDPNLGLIDLRTKQPISPAALAPLSAQEAAVLGKKAGDQVPLKLKNTASEILNRGIRITPANGRQLMVDAQGNTIKDLGAAPAALVLGNQLGPAGSGSAIDQAAERYSKDGTLPAGFSRSPGTTAAIIKRSAELHPDQDLASNKATFAADTAALKKVQTQFDAMTAFEGTALKNLDLYAQTAAKIPDLGAKFANVPLRAITGSMIGTDNMAALNAARQTASSEVAKVLSSATGAGVLSDSQKKEAEDVINGNLPLSATLAVVNTLKQDMANRHKSYQDDVNAIRGRIGAKPQSDTTAAAGSTVKMRAPNGAEKEVPADQVDHFKSLGATVIQ